MSLTVNQVGAFLTVAALAAVIVFGAQREAVKSAPVAGPAQTQTPAAPAKTNSATPLMAGHLAGCTEAKPCPVVKPVRTYRKVLRNGKLDGRANCKFVPKIADQFDRQQVLAAAERYGLSPEQLSALRVCLN